MTEFRIDTPKGVSPVPGDSQVWIYTEDDPEGGELEMIIRTDGQVELVSAGAPVVPIDVLIWLALMVGKFEEEVAK